MPLVAAVSSVVSDLFFMVDNSAYWSTLEHNEEGALNALQENAEQFCALIENLGETYTTDEIVADFLERA